MYLGRYPRCFKITASVSAAAPRAPSRRVHHLIEKAEIAMPNSFDAPRLDCCASYNGCRACHRFQCWAWSAGRNTDDKRVNEYEVHVKHASGLTHVLFIVSVYPLKGGTVEMSRLMLYAFSHQKANSHHFSMHTDGYKLFI